MATTRFDSEWKRKTEASKIEIKPWMKTEISRALATQKGSVAVDLDKRLLAKRKDAQLSVNAVGLKEQFDNIAKSLKESDVKEPELRQELSRSLSEEVKQNALGRCRGVLFCSKIDIKQQLQTDSQAFGQHLNVPPEKVLPSSRTPAWPIPFRQTKAMTRCLADRCSNQASSTSNVNFRPLRTEDHSELGQEWKCRHQFHFAGAVGEDLLAHPMSSRNIVVL